jgi:hypothetical protein
MADSNSTFNLAQLERHPNWYEHLPQVEAAMADKRRTSAARRAAGWQADEGGWYSPDGTHESDWELEAYPFPEDPGYQEWAEAFWHHERLDNEDPITTP